MRARTFWTVMAADESGAIERLVQRLADLHADYCVVGGQAVNAYVEPLVSLDLDLAIAGAELHRILPAFASDFRIEHFTHSVNLEADNSDLRVQFQLDPRYAAFVPRAEHRPVLGVTLLVAKLEDVLQGKIWAVLDPARRASKRQKDLADISRILEKYPYLRPVVPAEVLARLL